MKKGIPLCFIKIKDTKDKGVLNVSGKTKMWRLGGNKTIVKHLGNVVDYNIQCILNSESEVIYI